MVVLAVVAVVAVTLGAGITNAYGTGYRFQASALDLSDGAAADTFWDGAIVDVPGVSLYSVHCHGRVHFDLQYGSISPGHNNACYALMGVYSGGSGQVDTYIFLPVGNQALYRCSTNYGPWIYYFGDVIYAPPRSAPESFPPLEISVMLKGHC
jgi:hypothetical protein